MKLTTAEPEKIIGLEYVQKKYRNPFGLTIQTELPQKDFLTFHVWNVRTKRNLSLPWASEVGLEFTQRFNQSTLPRGKVRGRL